MEGSTVAASGRDRLLIRACALAIAALAWGYLVHLDHGMSSAIGPDMMTSPGMAMDAPVGDIVFLFTMWVVMMVGMMAVSATPVILLFAGAHAHQSRVPFVVPFFALGYAAFWVGFSALAAIAQWAMHDAAMLSSTMAASSSRVAGAILIGAGLYELTPIKGACLAHCRSPLGFLLAHWRDGKFGALQMGMRHALFCLGCCWALMGVLFAVGVMNLGWVAALMLLVLLEKGGPGGTLVARVAGVAMIGAGTWYLVGPR